MLFQRLIIYLLLLLSPSTLVFAQEQDRTDLKAEVFSENKSEGPPAIMCSGGYTIVVDANDQRHKIYCPTTSSVSCVFPQKCICTSTSVTIEGIQQRVAIHKCN